MYTMLRFLVLSLLCNTWRLALADAHPNMELEYSCTSLAPNLPCITDANGNRLTIRVKFIESLFVVSNPAAQQKVASMGRQYTPGITCSSNDTAVPECFVFGNWNGGWIGFFMHQVLKDIRVNVIALTDANTSNDVLEMYTGPSSYTRCVWEVKLGEVDLCVGDFWETPERRNLTAFTTQIDSDTFSLYTTPSPSLHPQFEDSNFLDIFVPFDSAVWLLLLVSIASCALALWFIEGSNDSKEYPLNVWGFFECVYQTFLAFVGGEHIASVLPSRILKVGLGILVYVYVNSYIASLASYFVVDNSVQPGVVGGLQDLMTNGGRLCLSQARRRAALPQLC